MLEQATLIKNYRNTKHKLLTTNASDKHIYLTHYMCLVGITGVFEYLLDIHLYSHRHVSALHEASS